MSFGDQQGDSSLDDFFVNQDEALVASYVGALEGAPSQARDVAELLTFWIDSEEFAIDIQAIQQILKVPAITPVPRTPKQILGITSLRGIIVPVVDLRSFLGIASRESTRESRVLVLRAEGDPIGLLVDRVSSVQRLDRNTIEAIPRTMIRGASDALEGVGRLDDRLLIILELQSVFDFLERSS